MDPSGSPFFDKSIAHKWGGESKRKIFMFDMSIQYLNNGNKI